MILVDDWKLVAQRAWSIRFNMLASLVIFGDFMFSIMLDKRAPLWVIAIGGAFNVGAIIARVVWQPRLRGG